MVYLRPDISLNNKVSGNTRNFVVILKDILFSYLIYIDKKVLNTVFILFYAFFNFLILRLGIFGKVIENIIFF